MFDKEPSLITTITDNGGGTKTISLEGELINSLVTKFQADISGESTSKVILDLSGILMIDKSGVEALIAATAAFAQAGGMLAIAAAPTTITATILQHSNPPTLFTDVSTALASFNI